jgi:hypothetical protein
LDAQLGFGHRKLSSPVTDHLYNKRKGEKKDLSPLSLSLYLLFCFVYSYWRRKSHHYLVILCPILSQIVSCRSCTMSRLPAHSRGPSTSFSHDPEPVVVNVSKVLHPDPEIARRRLYEDIDSVPHKKIKKICCIGAGYVVSVAAPRDAR